MRGLQNVKKGGRVSRALVKQQPDILFLQETHHCNVNYPVVSTNWFSAQYQAPGSSKMCGVAILLSKRMRFQLDSMESDPRGQFLFVKGKLDNFPIMLATIYAPNSTKILFVKEVLVKLQEFSQGGTILACDFNFIANAVFSRSHRTSQMQTPSETAATPLQSLCTKFSLTNIWQLKHPGEQAYTYFSLQ